MVQTYNTQYKHSLGRTRPGAPAASVAKLSTDNYIHIHIHIHIHII